MKNLFLGLALFLSLPILGSAQCQTGYKYVLGLDYQFHCIPIYDSNPIPNGTPFVGVTTLPLASVAIPNSIYLFQQSNVANRCLAGDTGGTTNVLCITFDQVSWHFVTLDGAGGGGSAAGPITSIQASDGAGGFQVIGCTGTSGKITCTPSGGAAGVFTFPQGTANTADTNSVGFQAPTSVPSGYNITLPGAPAAGFVKRTNATPSVESVSTLARGIGFVFDGGGSALTTSAVGYVTAPFACTISAWNMTVDTGTATIDVWKIATGSAIPTVSNTITASALPAIASGTALHSTTLTGWTTSVTANDIFGFKVNAVSSATRISIVLQCDQQ